MASYAKALRSKSENSHEIVINHSKSGYNNGSNGISRSLGASSGDISGEETDDWPELKMKVVPAPPPKDNPWRTNPNAAAVISKIFPTPNTTPNNNTTNSTVAAAATTTNTTNTSTPIINSHINDIEKSNSKREISSNSNSVQISSSNAKSTESLKSPSLPESSSSSSNSSGEKLGGSSRTPPSGPVKNNIPRSPVKSSHQQIRSGDSSSLPPRYGDRHNRGRGRGSSRGRGGNSSYRGGKNYHQISNSTSNHINYYSTEPSSEPILIPSTPTDSSYPPEFTTITPMYAPIQYFPISTFPPTPYATPIDTTGILTLTTDEQQQTAFPSFVAVDAYETNQRIEMVKNQIEYYFSDENLEKDFYLRRKMDSEGYLPVQLIATFHRIKNMIGSDFGIIQQAIQQSDKLECTSDIGFVRALNNPTKWPLPEQDQNMVSLSISLTAMSLLPSSGSSSVDNESELDGIVSASSPIDIVSAIQSSPSNSTSRITNGNGHSEMFRNLVNVPEFVPKSKILY